ncbi:MAG: class I SAM-dependent rRNA methyltransferase [Steroidobacteraceae bacterium]
MPVLRLKRGEDRRLRAGHPWVFSNEVDTSATPLTALEPGSLAALEDSRGQRVGWGTVNPHALICLRLLSRGPKPADLAAFLRERLRSALALRQRFGSARHARLVFGESDGLPGLVLDRFGDVIVGQIATRGMESLREVIETLVFEELSPRSLVWKNDSGARDLEALPHEQRVVGEPVDRLEVVEGELRFSVDLAGAQKTGWFYDQTDNRAAVARYVPKGARALDVCSYAGGWALSLLKAGATQATCVDSSQPALDAAAANAAANGFALDLRRGDAFDQLQALREAGERFDVVVVDPPAFIKRKKDQPQGEAAYRKLNQLAMAVLVPDGLLVSCSCSYHLAAPTLTDLLQAAARHQSRQLQVLEFRGQSADHPVLPAVPETRYLKAVFARVTIP